jgi:hypothetical protein
VTVLVDECVPVKLVRLLTGHQFTTAQVRGWGSFKNGKLLALAEAEFDLFLTWSISKTSRVGRSPSCSCPPTTGRP